MTQPERREAIIQATLPLLLDQGSDLSTREIAAAAGIAEGTIFRVFQTKRDLIHQTIAAALQPDQAIQQIQALPAGQPLEVRVEHLLGILLAEVHRTRALVANFCSVRGSEDRSSHPRGPEPFAARKQLVTASTVALSPHQDELRVPAHLAAQLLSALSLAAALEGDSDFNPHRLAQTVLHGIAEGAR